LILLALTALSYADSERGVIGVQLDSAPLPELLTKHLRLDAGQGVRISNVTVDSAADEAGLQRDDIIVAFQGEKIAGPEDLVEAVRKLGAGMEVTLEIVHLGERKTVELVLAPLPADARLKYPPEPKSVTSWRPGKVFKIGPEGQEWIEIPADEFPKVDFDVKEFFQEVHTYHHSSDGESFIITIEGDPADDGSKIVVRAGDKEYSTTVGEPDTLPEKYRGPAEEDVEDARTSVQYQIETKEFHLPKPPAPDMWREHFDNIGVPRPDLNRWSERKDRAVEELRQQMERLQQRMEEMERRNREMLDKLLQRKDKSGTTAERTHHDLLSTPQRELAT
jgi:hypothetical protein